MPNEVRCLKKRKYVCATSVFYSEIIDCLTYPRCAHEKGRYLCTVPRVPSEGTVQGTSTKGTLVLYLTQGYGVKRQVLFTGRRRWLLRTLHTVPIRIRTVVNPDSSIQHVILFAFCQAGLCTTYTCEYSGGT